MTDREFVQWLHGYLEISQCEAVGEKETTIIKQNLQSVFVKETTTGATTPIAAGPIFNAQMATVDMNTITVSC